jgi:hypothetical protein
MLKILQEPVRCPDPSPGHHILAPWVAEACDGGQDRAHRSPRGLGTGENSIVNNFIVFTAYQMSFGYLG